MPRGPNSSGRARARSTGRSHRPRSPSAEGPVASVAQLAPGGDQPPPQDVADPVAALCHAIRDPVPAANASSPAGPLVIVSSSLRVASRNRGSAVAGGWSARSSSTVWSRLRRRRSRGRGRPGRSEALGHRVAVVAIAGVQALPVALVHQVAIANHQHAADLGVAGGTMVSRSSRTAGSMPCWSGAAVRQPAVGQSSRWVGAPMPGWSRSPPGGRCWRCMRRPARTPGRQPAAGSNDGGWWQVGCRSPERTPPIVFGARRHLPATTFVGPAPAPTVRFNLSIDAAWFDPTLDDTAVGWARSTWGAVLQPFSTGGIYLNFAGLGDETSSLHRAALGANQDRLDHIRPRLRPAACSPPPPTAPEPGGPISPSDGPVSRAATGTAVVDSTIRGSRRLGRLPGT